MNDPALKSMLCSTQKINFIAKDAVARFLSVSQGNNVLSCNFNRSYPIQKAMRKTNMNLRFLEFGLKSNAMNFVQ